MENKGGGGRRTKTLTCKIPTIFNLKRKFLIVVLSIMFLLVGVVQASAKTYSPTAFYRLDDISSITYNIGSPAFYAGIKNDGTICVKLGDYRAINSTGFDVIDMDTGIISFIYSAQNGAFIQNNWYYATAKVTSGHSYRFNLTRGDQYVISSTGTIKFNGPISVPTVPTGLNVTGGSSGTLSWSANPVEDNVTTYEVYLNGSLVSSQSGTSYSFTGLAAGSYDFQVKAINSTGASNFSVTKPYNVLPNPPSPIVNNVTTSAAQISWETVYGATSYDVFVNGAFVTNTIKTTYDISGLLYNNRYTVSVVAKSSVGDSTPGATTFRTVDLPSPPEGLQVSNITSSTLDLSWLAVPGSITYILDQNDTIIATTANTFYHCTGLEPNTMYAYKVAVTTALGESNYSDPVVATTLGIPPMAPTGLSFGNRTSTSFTLYWLKQTDSTGYKVYLDGNRVGNVSQPLLFNPSFEINNLESGSTHSMTVIAVNQWGESTASQCLTVTLLPVPTGLNVSNITANSLDLSWPACSGATSYVIFQNGFQISTTTGTTYNIASLSPNTAYSFQIAVVNGVDQSTLSDSVKATTLGLPPLAPTSLSAGNITHQSFTLYWIKQPDVVSYNVYMDGTFWGKVAQPLLFNPSLNISDLADGSTHTMTVTAVNQWGEGAASLPLSVTTSVQSPVLKANIDNSTINLTWTGVGSSFKIMVDGNPIKEVSSSPYTLTEKPGTYQIQIIQNYKDQLYPSNIVSVTISVLQNVGAAQMTRDIISSAGIVIVPIGGLLTVALALKGSPMLFAMAKAFLLKN